MGRNHWRIRVFLVVARKRLPAPFAQRTTKPNPTVVVLPVRTTLGSVRKGV
jgi:hypothetical protein